MSLNFYIPRLGTPVIGPDGSMSREWYLFFSALLQMVGGPAVVLGQISLADYQDELLTDRQPKRYDGELNEISNAAQKHNLNALIQSLATRISDLEAQVQNGRSASSSNSAAIMDNATYSSPAYCLWVKGYSGNQIIYSTSTKYTFNPNSGALKVTQYEIGGGSAAVVLDGIYGIPGTSLSFAVNGLNAATLTSIGFYSPAFNNVTITKPTTGSIFTLIDGKTLTVDNTLTLAATDGSTLAIGAGGTLGTAAYTAATAYVPANSPVASGGAAPAPGAAYDQTIADANNALLNIIRSALVADGILS